MISHLHKTVFVHVKKCGGTSVHSMFPDAEHSGLFDILMYHIILGESIKDYFVWSSIRNPWSRAVSLFAYHHQLERDCHTDNFKTFIMDMYQGIVEDTYHNYYYFTPNIELYLDTTDRIALDYIVNLDTLEREFDYIKKRLNLPADCKCPRLNKSIHADYRSYYDNETIDAVAFIAKKDIDAFGFVYDDPTIYTLPPDVGGDWRSRFTTNIPS